MLQMSGPDLIDLVVFVGIIAGLNVLLRAGSDQAVNGGHVALFKVCHFCYI